MPKSLGAAFVVDERLNAYKSVVPSNEFVARSRYAGIFKSQPIGLLLHSTRSGGVDDVEREYRNNVSYAKNNVQRDARGDVWYLGWNATIGDYKYANHISAGHWGWNARGLSSVLIAYEFAQGRQGYEITDGQVWACVHHIREEVRTSWPNLYDRIVSGAATIVEHWDTEPGRMDGKSDVAPDQKDVLKNRILNALRYVHGSLG